MKLLSACLALAFVTGTPASASKVKVFSSTGGSRLAASRRVEELSDTPYIIGGTEVEMPIPYFGFWSAAGCGASLIHDDILLSAAHCDVGTSGTFYLGGLDLYEGVTRTPIATVSHPSYISATGGYDFMIVKLDSSALEDASGNPTGLSTIELNRDPSNPQDNDPLVVMGFGSTGDGSLSDELMEVQVEYVSDDDCANSYGSYFKPDIMFCAGVDEGGKDSCQGKWSLNCFLAWIPLNQNISLLPTR